MGDALGRVLRTLGEQNGRVKERKEAMKSLESLLSVQEVRQTLDRNTVTMAVGEDTRPPALPSPGPQVPLPGTVSPIFSGLPPTSTARGPHWNMSRAMAWSTATGRRCTFVERR